MTTAQSFGQLLRHYRRTAGLSQEELAFRASLSPQAISLLERGARRFPRRETVDALAGALELDTSPAASLTEAARRAPASKFSQLPPAVASFTGRESVLQLIVERLSASGDNQPAVPILAIDGMPGAGKTSLAVKAAHEVLGSYPDGQLFIDLHGFTDGVAPEDPSAVLARILRLLGLTDQGIPDDLAQRAALYRSTLAGKRMLIVLDNALSAAQITPLLPGTAGCAVLITSRSRLAGLGTARPVSIGPLDDAEAVALFTEVAGRTDQPALLSRLVELCGHLPLVVEIVAAQYRDRQELGLVDIVEELTAHSDSLTDLHQGESSVNAAFQISYAQLSPAHRRLFRLISLNPGPRLDETAAATVTEQPIHSTRDMLEHLVDHHLLDEGQPGIYRFHDLVRSFAFHTSTAEDSPAERQQAVDRLYRHYVEMASRAMDLAYSYDGSRRPQSVAPAEFGSTLADHTEGEAWLDREMDTLLRIAHSDAGHTVVLGGILHRHLQVRGRISDAEKLGSAALGLATTNADHVDEVRLLNNLGVLLQMRGDGAEAAQLYQRALTLAETVRWKIGQLVATLGQGEVERIAGHNSVAAAHYRAALVIAQAVDDPSGQLRALVGLGDVERLVGNLEDARTCYQQASSLGRQIDDHLGAISADVGLGGVCYDLGFLAEAAERYQEAAALAARIQHGPAWDYAQRSLANAYRATGRASDSVEILTESLAYNRRIGDGVAELGALINLAESLLACGCREPARAHYQEGLELAIENGDEGMRLEAHRGIGKILHGERSFEAAIMEYRQALKLADLTGEKLNRGRLLHDVALAEIELGQIPEAVLNLRGARDLFAGLSAPELSDVQANLEELDDEPA